MDTLQQQKYQLRIVTIHGNAFEAVTTMNHDIVSHAIGDAIKQQTFVLFTCLNERDEPVNLDIFAPSIEGVMIQKHTRLTAR